MAESKVYTNLKKLFSSDVIVRNIGDKQLKVIDVDSIQKFGMPSQNDRFTRMYSTMNYRLSSQQALYGMESQRLRLFRDYETMDTDAIISAALDIFSEESTMKNEMGEVLRITAGNQKVKNVLENLFYEILNIEFTLPTWVRGMAKYGDYFLNLELAENYGVTNVIPLPVYEVKRIEGEDPTKPNVVKFYLEGAGAKGTFDNFEVAHFRMLSDSNYLPYGKCLTGDTKIWTTTGYKEIKNIEKDDEVYSFDYENKKTIKTKVKQTIYSGYKNVYEIKTAHRKIKATDTHPFMLKDGTYKLLNELTINDEIILPFIDNKNKYPKLIVDETDDWKYDNKLKIISEEVLQNNFSMFVRFFGFMLGDGWLDKSNKTVCFSLGDRLDKSKKYIDFITELGINYRLTNEYESNSTCIVNSVYLYKLLLQLNFLTGSKNKIVPDWAWLLNSDNKREFIEGFADADGCDLNDGIWQIGTINENMMIDMREIATQSGFSTTKIWSTKGNNSRMYLFTVRKKSRDFHISDKNTFATEKIRKIEFVGKDDVYDLQIDNDLHNFVANGIVVHNSMIEPGRRVWKQLILMEDAMLIHRIMRAPERRIFKIDVGNIAPNEVDAYMKQIIAQVKKVPYIDSETGEYNLKFNLQNMTEDFYLPVRGGDSGTEIDNLGGLEYNSIDDIEYLKNKLLASLKVPKAFIGYDESVGSRATLAAEDVRFARTIERIQKIIVSELYKIGLIHLYIQGFKGNDLVDFDLELTSPSIIFEQEKIELWNSKASLARDIKDLKMMSEKWIYKNIFNMTNEDMVEEDKEVIKDQKKAYRLEQIEQDGNDPAESGQGFDDGDQNENYNLQYENDGDYEPVKPSEDGRKGSKSRTRKKDEPFGEDPIGQKDYNKIMKLDTEINPVYDGNKKKHLNRKISKAESIFGKSISNDEDAKRVISEGDLLNLKNYFNIKKDDNQINIHEKNKTSKKQKNDEKDEM